MSILFGVLFMFSVRAENITTIQTNQIKQSNIEVVDVKKFSMQLNAGYSSNLRKNSSPDQDDSSSLVLLPSYQISEKSSLSARLDIIQNHDSENRTKFSNLIITHNPRTFDLSEELKLKPNFAAILPTDNEIREQETYRGGIGFRPALEYTPKKLSQLTITNGLSLTKSFHEYEVQSNYAANIEYAARYRLTVDYDLSKKIHLQLVNDFVKAWTYNGYTRESFSFWQELSYEFITSWSTYLGHNNQGSVRGPNNNGENIAIYKGTSSYLSMGLRHSF